MTRGLLLAVLALLLVAAPAGAADRLDTLAAQLKTGPLAIDADLVSFLGAQERRDLARTLEDSPVPIRVALLPAIDEDESGGDPYRQLRGLADRVGEPGVYVVVAQDGSFETAAVDVPREIDPPFELRTGFASTLLDDDPPVQEPQPTRTIAERLSRFAAFVASAPAAEPEPFVTTAYEDDELHHVGPRSSGVDWEGQGIAFGVLGLFAGLALYGLTALTLRMGGRRRA